MIAKLHGANEDIGFKGLVDTIGIVSFIGISGFRKFIGAIFCTITVVVEYSGWICGFERFIGLAVFVGLAGSVCLSCSIGLIRFVGSVVSTDIVCLLGYRNYWV